MSVSAPAEAIPAPTPHQERPQSGRRNYRAAASVLLSVLALAGTDYTCHVMHDFIGTVGDVRAIENDRVSNEIDPIGERQWAESIQQQEPGELKKGGIAGGSSLLLGGAAFALRRRKPKTH